MRWLILLLLLVLYYDINLVTVVQCELGMDTVTPISSATNYILLNIFQTLLSTTMFIFNTSYKIPLLLYWKILVLIFLHKMIMMSLHVVHFQILIFNQSVIRLHAITMQHITCHTRLIFCYSVNSK